MFCPVLRLPKHSVAATKVVLHASTLCGLCDQAGVSPYPTQDVLQSCRLTNECVWWTSLHHSYISKQVPVQSWGHTPIHHFTCMEQCGKSPGRFAAF